MRSETVTSPPIYGAARKVSYAWPATGPIITNTIPANRQAVQMRAGMLGIGTYWTVTDTGGPPATRGGTVYKGRSAWAITASNVTGTQCSPNFTGTNRPLTMPFQSLKGTSDLTDADDLACWSFAAILAYDAIPGAITGDIGLVLGVGTRSNIRGAPTFAGVCFGPSNTGVMSVFIRQADAGAVTFNQPTPFQPTQTEYNKYEIRLVSPVGNAEACMKFFINGKLQFNLPYGVGTVLPEQSIATAPAFLSFTPGIINLNATAAGTTRLYLPPLGVTICAGPTEDALA